MRRLLIMAAFIAVLGALPAVAFGDPAHGGVADTQVTYFKFWEIIGSTQLVGALPLPDETVADVTLASTFLMYPATPPIDIAIPATTLSGQTVDARSISGTCAGPGGSASSPQGGLSQPDANHIYMTLLCTAQVGDGPSSAFTIRTSEYLRSRIMGVTPTNSSDSADAPGTYTTAP